MSTAEATTYFRYPRTVFSQDTTVEATQKQTEQIQKSMTKSKTEVIKIAHFSSLRESFVRRNYIINSWGFALSVLALIIAIAFTNPWAILATLPFALGFANMFFTVRKDIKKLKYMLE
jgi:hypothetical protein